VTCIYRDGNRFLWVGTQDGLNRFDGYRFFRFRHDEKDSTSISDRYVTAIMEDGSGNLLVGTRNGLNLLDRSGRRFLRIYPDSNLRKGIQYAFEKIERAGNGDLFLSGADFLYHWDHRTRRIQRIRTEEPTIQNFTAYGDACYQFGRQGQWIKYQAPFRIPGISEPDGLFREKYRVQVDRKARIWKWTQPSDELTRFERYDITTGRWMDPIDIGEKVNHVSFDRENTAWVSTMNGIVLVRESGEVRHFEVDGKRLGSEVLFTHTDNEGLAWIGFARRGLAMFDPTMKAFTRKQAPLNDEPVLSSLELPGGELLMGTPSGLYLSSKRGSRLVFPGATSSLKRTTGGEIWAGTENHGVMVMDHSLRVKRRFDKGNGTFRENRIHHLEYDGSGDRMIVSTIDGAYVHTFKDGTWTTLSAGSPGNPYSPLCGNYVLHSTVLRNGDLLFATNSGYSIVGVDGKPTRKVYSDSDTCRFIRKTIIIIK
jgi:ligand-binding sensor domain-containing protein